MGRRTALIAIGLSIGRVYKVHDKMTRGFERDDKAVRNNNWRDEVWHYDAL